MYFIGRSIKYLLRSIFSIVIFLMFVGLAKMNRNTSTYVDFLNNNNWSVFHWSQPATWGDPFWPNKQYSGGIADVVSLDVLNSEDS